MQNMFIDIIRKGRINYRFGIVDHSVLTSFLNRWHNKTKILYLSVGEIAMKPNDVLRFFCIYLSKNICVDLIVGQVISNTI